MTEPWAGAGADVPRLDGHRPGGGPLLQPSAEDDRAREVGRPAHRVLLAVRGRAHLLRDVLVDLVYVDAPVAIDVGRATQSLRSDRGSDLRSSLVICSKDRRSDPRVSYDSGPS